MLFNAERAYATSCVKPTAGVIAECSDNKCFYGFKLKPSEPWGCNVAYSIEVATENDIKALEARVFGKNSKNVSGIYIGDELEFRTLKKLDFDTIEEAKIYWEKWILTYKNEKAFVDVAEFFIGIMLFIILWRLGVDNRKRHILKSFIAQISIILLTLVLVVLSPFYSSYLFSSYFFDPYDHYLILLAIVGLPMVWALKIVLAIVDAIYKSFKKPKLDSP